MNADERAAQLKTSLVLPVPMPPRWPIVGRAIGHLPGLLSPEGHLAWLNAQAERYRDTGIFQITTPSGLTPVFVGTVDLAAELFDETRFQKVVEGPMLRIRRFAGDGLFTADGDDEKWHRAHRVLVPAFSRNAMDRYFPTMQRTVDELLAKWRKAADDHGIDGGIDVTADMTRLTLETISRCGFDHDFKSFERAALDPFLQALARCMREAVEGLHRPASLGFLFAGKERAFQNDIDSMFALVDDVIAGRRRRPRETWPQDFLSLMLEQADPKTGEKLDDENVRHQILTFLVAGHETTSGLLAFAVHQIASDKKLAQALRDEVDAGCVDPQRPTRDEVWRLDLHMRVLSEALRLWPTVPVLSVASTTDQVIGGRWHIPANTPIKVLIGALHNDPTSWPSPRTFDPDRFLPDVVATRAPAAFKPFGNGRRSCIGRQFALLEAALTLASIVRDFDLEVPAPLTVAPTTSPKPQDFRLRVRPRATTTKAARATTTTTTETKTAAQGGCPFHRPAIA